jgi:hypothetical protein
MRTVSAMIVVAILALGAAATVRAQAPPSPQTYSFTQTSSMMGSAMTVKIVRDGSRESMEQIVAPGANGPGMDVRALYDFAAHKVYTIDVTGVHPCTVVTYTSPNVPPIYDPIPGAAEITAGLAQAKPAVLRTETLNGIRTKVIELPNADGNGKTRMWLEEKLNFQVKWVTVAANGQEQTMMEIRALSFAKPPADLFVPPQNCQAVAGETNANGGHVEMGVETSTPAAGRSASPQAPAKRTPQAGNAGQLPQARAQVTEVRALAVGPDSHYAGPSPAAFEFKFSITASGPADIKYILVNQADRVSASGTLTFDAAGTKELTVPIKVGVPNGTHWDGSGKLQVYAPNKIESEPVKISADCRKQ